MEIIWRLKHVSVFAETPSQIPKDHLKKHILNADFQIFSFINCEFTLKESGFHLSCKMVYFLI